MAGITVPTDAYCTVAEVQGLLPNRVYTSGSKPSIDQAENFCKEIAEEINAILRGLEFSPPLTDSGDVRFLKLLNKLGAAWLCESATLVGVQGRSDIAQTYKERYDAMIKALMNGEYKFAGAGAVPSAEPDGQDDLDASGSRTDPIFQISEDERKTQF